MLPPSKPLFGARNRPFGAWFQARCLPGALLWFGLSLLFSCSDTRAEGSPLRVLAASSLRDVLDELAQDFEVHTGHAVQVVTGGSTLVANQLLAGAEADVFLSAGVAEVDRLSEAGLLLPDSWRSVFHNQLVVIVPADSATGSTQSPTALFAGNQRLSIAHPEAVPAGRYAKAWLAELGLWEQLRPRSVYALDVRAALAAVESGALDLGIVYRTDAESSNKVRIVHEVDPHQGQKIVYPGVILQGSQRPEVAALFLDFVTGGGAAVARAHGFGGALDG